MGTANSMDPTPGAMLLAFPTDVLSRAYCFGLVFYFLSLRVVPAQTALAVKNEDVFHGCNFLSFAAEEAFHGLDPPIKAPNDSLHALYPACNQDALP